MRNLIDVLKLAGSRWYADNTFRLGAALAYYTIFSLAPIVLLSVAMASLVFDKKDVREHLLREIDKTAGDRVGTAIEVIVDSGAGSGTTATIMGFVILFIGATSVFVQLQDALNYVWGVKPKPGRRWFAVVAERLWSFAIVLAIGFLLFVSLVISTTLTAVNHFVQMSDHPGGVMAWQTINWVVSFGVTTILFALIYKILPDVKIDWSDVGVGAAVTAFLFIVGKHLIGYYLAQASWISGYGAAGSLIVVLLWVYYSSQLFLFGAEFTYAYAKQRGKPLVPTKSAEAITEEARLRLTESGIIQPGTVNS